MTHQLLTFETPYASYAHCFDDAFRLGVTCGISGCLILLVIGLVIVNTLPSNSSDN